MYTCLAALAEKPPSVYFQNVAVTLAGGLLCFWVGRTKIRTGRNITEPGRTLRVGDTLVAPAPPLRSERIQGRVWVGAGCLFALGFLFNLAKGLSVLPG